MKEASKALAAALMAERQTGPPGWTTPERILAALHDVGWVLVERDAIVLRRDEVERLAEAMYRASERSYEDITKPLLETNNDFRDWAIAILAALAEEPKGEPASSFVSEVRRVTGNVIGS